MLPIWNLGISHAIKKNDRYGISFNLSSIINNLDFRETDFLNAYFRIGKTSKYNWLQIKSDLSYLYITLFKTDMHLTGIINLYPFLYQI